jgi:PAS domain S-box-containing protein
MDYVAREIPGSKARSADAGGVGRRTEALLGTKSLQNEPESRDLFRLAVESCPSGMVMSDSTGKIILLNGAVERMFGYSLGELIGQPVDILVPEMLRPQHAPHGDGVTPHPNSRPGGTSRHLFGLRRDATEFPVEVTLNPIHAGDDLLLLSVMVDVSARQDAETHLAQMERRYRGLLEAAPDAMVVVDQSGEIVLLNVQAEKQFGYHRDELVGQKVKNIIPEGFAERLIADGTRTAAAALAQQIGMGIELSGRRKDGSEFPIEIMLSPLQSDEGILVTAAIRDISVRKTVETHLAQMEGMDRLKDEFVSTVSHELRTPLTSIAGALGLLIGNAAGKLPEHATRLLAIAHTNSQRLVRLVNDILDIEKMESGQILFSFKRVEARALVKQAIEGNRGFADSYGIRVRLDPESTAGEVHADPDRLAQVVTNLLSNAIKFSPPGGEVVVAIQQRDRSVRISVRDHGPGIPPDFRPHMFEKFAQADASNTRRKGGTGLGLSIVKQIVTRLGGTVDFDDAPGGGTVFQVDLAGRDQVAEREIDRDGKPGAARILLCADDPQAALAMRQCLHHFGFATDFAHARADAIARAAAATYGAVVVDLELPDGESVGLIRELRNQPRNGETPIIGMTADTGRDRDVPTPSAPDDWLDKPVDIDRLAQILDRVVVCDANGRPHILHLDDDPDVREVVPQALGTTAEVANNRLMPRIAPAPKDIA